MRLLCSDKHTNVWRHCFVGRQVECEPFRTACQTDTQSFTVLHLFAPGGADKIARLAEFARIAAKAGAPAVVLDSRKIAPSPPSLHCPRPGASAALAWTAESPTEITHLEEVAWGAKWLNGAIRHRHSDSPSAAPEACGRSTIIW